MQIRILFDGGFLRCLIFLCRLISQVRQLLLGGIALIRSCLLQFCFRSLLLLENRVSRGKVRLHSLKLGLGLFLLLHLLLYSRALLGHDLLEVCVRLGVFSTPYSDLSHGVRRLLVIRRGKRCDRDGINAGTQVGNAVFAVGLGFTVLLRTLLAHCLHGQTSPRLPVDVQNLSADRSCLGGSAGRQHGNKGRHKNCGEYD